MKPLDLSLACGRYDRVVALADGAVQPVGIELRWVDLPPEEIFWRMVRYREFDVSELSLSSFLVAKDQGDDDLCAIPVFPLRRFRHSAIYVRSDGSVEQPGQLAGRRVGVPEYQMTAALWVRGFLQHEYGVSSPSIHWVTGGQIRPGRVERVPISLPPDIHVEHAGEVPLEALLTGGGIDALISPQPPKAMLSGAVRRLFPDFKAVEVDYFRRTRIFPIMHTVVIRRAVLDRHPWVARNLYSAFSAAKDVWYASLGHEAARMYGLPWATSAIVETFDVMGTDFWPYGVERNRHTLETAARYSWEQGLIRHPSTLDEMFVKNAWGNEDG